MKFLGLPLLLLMCCCVSAGLNARVGVLEKKQEQKASLKSTAMDGSVVSNITLQNASTGAGLATLSLLGFIFYMNGRRWKGAVDRLVEELESTERSTTAESIKDRVYRKGVDSKGYQDAIGRRINVFAVKHGNGKTSS